VAPGAFAAASLNAEDRWVVVLIGTAHDRSGIPRIRLEVTALSTGARTEVECADATPGDGQWTCDWDLGGGVTELYARVTAPDGTVSWDPVIRAGGTWRYVLAPQVSSVYALRIVARDHRGNTRDLGPFAVEVAYDQCFLPLILED